jgi:hypothetical protein
MICQVCHGSGAGLRYTASNGDWWFHAKCWRDLREAITSYDLTLVKAKAENGDAETSAQTPAPANP